MGEQTSMDLEPGSSIVVCVKWVATRLEVDPVDGSVTHQPHESWFSAADLAAVETALRIADERAGRADGDHAVGSGPEVVVVCVGPSSADDSLRDLIAAGVDRVIRIDAGSRPDPSDQPTSVTVAKALAETIRTIGDPTGSAMDSGISPDVLVVCGDVSADRGSGSVPAFLADELACAQALGLLEVSSASTNGTLRCVRRLDGGRRELLTVPRRAVISVEGSVGRLRRAPLAAMVASRDATIDVRSGDVPTDTDRAVLSPYRPRTRVVDPPSGKHALERIEELTGARTDRTPPRTITVEPHEAARAILDQLREWGYEWRSD